MGLFSRNDSDSDEDNKIDLDTILSVAGGGLLGAAGQLPSSSEPSPEMDWTPIIVVAAVGMGLLLLMSSRR